MAKNVALRPNVALRTQERLTELVDAIREGNLSRKGYRAKDYAEKWGLHPQRVGELMSQAKRIVAATIRDPHHVAAKVGSRMERIVDNGEDRDSVAAGKLLATMAGLIGRPADEPGITPDELVRRIVGIMTPEQVRYVGEQLLASVVPVLPETTEET